jgi:hypothetical protein
MAQQPSGEFASTDPTKGEEDARVRERRVGAKISLSACSSPQHLQRPTSSSSSLSSLRRSRLRDRGNLRFRSPDRASQPLHQLTRLPNPRRPRQSPLFNLAQRVMNRMFQNAVWPTSRRLELSSRLQRLSVSTAGAPCSRPSISYPSRRLSAELLCQTSCTFALQFAGWLSNVAAPLVRVHAGRDLATVTTGPGYVCRHPQWRSTVAGQKERACFRRCRRHYESRLNRHILPFRIWLTKTIRIIDYSWPCGSLPSAPSPPSWGQAPTQPTPTTTIWTSDFMARAPTTASVNGLAYTIFPSNVLFERDGLHNATKSSLARILRMRHKYIEVRCDSAMIISSLFAH